MLASLIEALVPQLWQCGLHPLLTLWTLLSVTDEWQLHPDGAWLADAADDGGQSALSVVIDNVGIAVLALHMVGQSTGVAIAAS